MQDTMDIDDTEGVTSPPEPPLTPPSWWNKPIPKTTTYGAMINTAAAPDVMYQYTDSMSRMMIVAQMATIWMLENGELSDSAANKKQLEEIQKANDMFEQQFQARHNELDNLMSHLSQKPNPPMTAASPHRQPGASKKHRV